MAFQAPATCSGNSSRAWPIAFTSWHPICQVLVVGHAVRATTSRYTFANLAGAIERFTEVVELQAVRDLHFRLWCAGRLAHRAKHPERITAIISQNGNAYEEGLS